MSQTQERAKDLARRVRRRLAEREPRNALRVERVAARLGDDIWVTLDAPASGRLSAVDLVSGERFAFPDTVEPGPRTVTLPVATLPATEGATYRLEFSAGGSHRPVVDRHRSLAPTIAPVTSDGRWRVHVEPHRRGVRIARSRVAPVVEVRHLGADEDRVIVSWDGVADERLLAIVEESDAVLTLDTTTDGGRASLRLGTVGGLADGQVAALVLERGGDRVPLGRADHDLRRPQASVLMPEASDLHGRVRFTWSSTGHLQLRKDAPA